MTKNSNKVSSTLHDVGGFLAKFTEHSDHVYWISTPDFKRIQYISPSYERIWGRTREALYLNPEIWITYLHPDDVKNHHPIHEMAKKIEMLGEQARYSEHYRIIRPDGEIRWIMDNGFPLINEQGDCFGVTGIAIDVSQQKKQEETLRIAKEAAEAATRAKTAFIANMSHDIRTPLTGVVGMSRLLEDTLFDHKQKQYARWLGESGDQLLHMLNGILDVVSADHASEEDIHENTFDVRQIIDDIVQLERPSTLLKGIDLITHVDEKVPHCLISDTTKINHILLNLLGNAIKFTSVGHVGVYVTWREETDEHVRLQFRVDDTGIGIPPECQGNVFDRFFRATPSDKGTYTGHGMGLHIAQTYARLLGSNIHLTSELDVGSTFYFDATLKKGVSSPITPPAESIGIDASMLSADKEIPPQKAPNLLLIEDNVIALHVLENLVTQAGCHFTSAVNGEAAFKLATRGGFDIIITDLGLPGISGIEFTKKLRAYEIKKHLKAVPIIGLTAHTQGAVKDNCLKAGMMDAYSKPIDLSTLEHIKTRFYRPPALKQTPGMQAGGKLGFDLPNTEQELFQLHAFDVLNT
ncbi:MAG TPA: hypothetical protein DDY37_08155, partial [Legionella sp.]|nr:hypothetical protein [Legionella sp.]